MPLIPEIEHFLLAGSLSAAPFVSALFGDAIVPIASATNVDDAVVGEAAEALPRSHVKLLSGVGHLALAHHAGVYAALLEWTKDSEAV